MLYICSLPSFRLLRLPTWNSSPAHTLFPRVAGTDSTATWSNHRPLDAVLVPFASSPPDHVLHVLSYTVRQLFPDHATDGSAHAIHVSFFTQHPTPQLTVLPARVKADLAMSSLATRVAGLDANSLAEGAADVFFRTRVMLYDVEATE